MVIAEFSKFAGISWQIDGDTVETVADFSGGSSKITADGDSAMKLKVAYSLEEKL